jgi:hypothetical protein
VLVVGVWRFNYFAVSRDEVVAESGEALGGEDRRSEGNFFLPPPFHDFTISLDGHMSIKSG